MSAMQHYPTLGRDGAAYIAQCDCDWRSTNTWSWSEALAEFEAHAENPYSLGTTVSPPAQTAPADTPCETGRASGFPPWARYPVG